MSSDLLAWVRLDDGWLHNVKVRRAGLFGRALYIASICYAHRLNTDGRIDADVIDLLAAEAGLTVEQANEAATRLMDVGLFDRRADGWHVHDYERAQDTKAERDAVRESARARQARSRASHTDVTRDSHVSHGEVTTREESRERVEETCLGPSGPPSDPPKVKEPNRRRRVSDTFEPSESSLEWARINVPGVDVKAETAKFIDHHVAKGSVFADHQRAWTNWMRRAEEFGPARAGGRTVETTTQIRARMAREGAK